MGEKQPRQIDEEFAALVSGLEAGRDDFDDDVETRPALLIERLTTLDHEVPIGIRARFLMTTYIGGELAAYGWRTDLRISSPIEKWTAGLEEPGVGLVEEGEYYNHPEASGQRAGVSRVWIETLVRIPAAGLAPDGPDEWLSAILTNPNQPHVEVLHPVARRHHLIGSRVVHERPDGRYKQNLRAVAPPLMSESGALVVAVVDEEQWYHWNRRSYTITDRMVGHLPVDELWVE